MKRIMSILSDTWVYSVAMNARLSFGEWLGDELNRLRLTQQEFADAAGVGQSTVSSWIAGETRPRRRAIPQIAAALGVEPVKVSDVLQFGAPPRDQEPITPITEQMLIDDPLLNLWAAHGEEFSADEREMLMDLTRGILERKHRRREQRVDG